MVMTAGMMTTKMGTLGIATMTMVKATAMMATTKAIAMATTTIRMTTA